ncbi:hypothetical protein RYX45_01485 [Alkalihalophilus pseudofirmus]|uniref:Uncharacterized protein n=1 Tax=Alkalihalophilus pseudofirmus TaxID=79885 RepID=A0AAJ2NMJ8_ALKPS|nr:hypothetical protein [Alkalihalophilus pseudofirmus]MDV2883835.1 hypothetical protein [Alkalihalophilus pseudofirmus]
MIELMRTIFHRLDVGWKVYHEEARGSEQNPVPKDYIIYKLPPYSSFTDRDDYVLEVTLWSFLDGRDTTHLELKWDEIDKRLKKYIHLDEYHLLQFVKTGGGQIPDPDPNVRRRELRYLIKRSERVDIE